jgi:hypothetical protein
MSALRKPGLTQNTKQEAEVTAMANQGIIEFSSEACGPAAFRILTNCVVCPKQSGLNVSVLSHSERRVLKWIKLAGLRLTIAELTFLEEHRIKPKPSLLGAKNRQALTELIYTTETVADTILEALMEKSQAMDGTVKIILGLLRKRKIYLI